MAKYTLNDPDIQYLDQYDKNNYNFELLKFDVDKAQEAYLARNSVKFITNPSLIGEMFISPTHFTMGIFSLVVFLLTVVIIIYIIIFILLKMIGGSDNDIKLDIMKKVFYYIVICLLILIILYWLLNKIILETTSTGFIVKV
jgi:hypothetical protein